MKAIPISKIGYKSLNQEQCASNAHSLAEEHTLLLVPQQLTFKTLYRITGSPSSEILTISF